MKEHELKRCFERIKPREQLIDDTLCRVHELQNEKVRSRVRRTSFDWSFATRLASAACALLLVVGVGISLGTAGNLPHKDDVSKTSAVEPMDIGHGEQPGDVVSPDAPYDLEGMSERAAELADDWAVLDAVIDMATGDGSIVLSVAEVCDGAGGRIVPDGEADQQPTLLAYFDASNAQMQALFDAVGGRVLVGVHAEQREGSPVWVIHEFHPVEEIQS